VLQRYMSLVHPSSNRHLMAGQHLGGRLTSHRSRPASCRALLVRVTAVTPPAIRGSTPAEAWGSASAGKRHTVCFIFRRPPGADCTFASGAAGRLPFLPVRSRLPLRTAHPSRRSDSRSAPHPSNLVACRGSLVIGCCASFWDVRGGPGLGSSRRNRALRRNRWCGGGAAVNLRLPSGFHTG